MLIKNSGIIQLHAVFQILGIAAQAHYVAQFLRQMWEVNHQIYGLVSWAGRAVPPKIEIMLEYGLLLTFTAVAILAISTYAQHNKERIEISISRWVMLGAYELVCLLFSSSAFWIVLAALLPTWFYSRNLPPRSVVAERVSLILAFGAIVGVLWILSATSWKTEVRVSNEYSDFTEYTRLKDGRLVNNAEYFRTHLDYFPNEFNTCEEQPIIKVVRCLHLSNSVFPNSQAALTLFPPSMGITYEWEKEILMIHKMDLTVNEYQLIESLWRVRPRETLPPPSWRKSTDLDYFYSINISVVDNIPKYGKGFFDNHGRLYLPALKAAFREAHATMAPYGVGLTKTLGRLLSITSSLTFNGYYFIYWCSVYAYLLLLTLVTWRITRNAWAAVIALAAGIYAELGASLSTIELNPILHFPDLICLMVVAYDVRRSTISSALIRASAFGFMIWWSLGFGLSLLVASMAWHLLEGSSANGNWRRILPKLGLESLIAAIVIFGISKVSVSNLTVISGRTTYWWQVSIMAPLIFILIWARFMNNRPTSHQKYHFLDIAGIWALYSMLVIVFVMPEGVINGAAMLLFAVPPSTIFFTWHLDKRVIDKVVVSRFISYIAFASIVILASALATNQLHYRDFSYGFENHRIFAWHFPGLFASSTADPEIMQKSVNLIREYQPEGQLQLISKYDNWVRILIGRPDYYTNIEWRAAVASHEKINNTVTLIIQSNIPFLFVDRELLEGGVLHTHNDTRNMESFISQVLRGVSRCYTPGEVGGLLQVWHRSCAME